MLIEPLRAVLPNPALIASAETFFGVVKEHYLDYRARGMFADPAAAGLWVYRLAEGGEMYGELGGHRQLRCDQGRKGDRQRSTRAGKVAGSQREPIHHRLVERGRGLVGAGGIGERAADRFGQPATLGHRRGSISQGIEQAAAGVDPIKHAGAYRAGADPLFRCRGVVPVPWGCPDAVGCGRESAPCLAAVDDRMMEYGRASAAAVRSAVDFGASGLTSLASCLFPED